MNITGLQTAVVETYSTVAAWCFAHQVEVDVIVGVFAIGCFLLILRNQRKARRRLHRILWGTWMKRKDQQRYHQMMFEDALVDAAMEMVHRGDMNESQEKAWFKFFAERYEFGGLIPAKDVKRGIKARMKHWYANPNKWKISGRVPGGVKQVVVDKTYDPNAPVEGGLSTSKYCASNN